MTDSTRPPMAGNALDRDAQVRRSETELDAAWNEESARLLQLRDGDVLVVRDSGGSMRLHLAPMGAARESRHLYLGRIAGAPVFAEPEGGSFPEVDIVDTPAAGTAETSEILENVGLKNVGLKNGGIENEGLEQSGLEQSRAEWVSPFVCAAEIPEIEREALAAALALSAWHHSMGFSPRDGGALESTQGGWARIDSHGEHFPRTDPVVIVLIEHEDRLLLGSNALWESDRFSLLAGYIEAGESAEAAVAREVFEESGVRLTDIRYVASQPWPFPRSLMLGFRARLAPGVDPHALFPDPEEISELRWFTRSELATPESLLLPRPLSIARWMIDRWLSEDGRG